MRERCLLVAELATGHGGDVALAGDMIRAAADAGADLVKLQSYTLSKLNPRDPQRDWLTKAHLDTAAHEQLLQVGRDCGIEVFSTPFDAEALQMLRDLGLKRFKIASSESASDWWMPTDSEEWVISYPWGNRREFSGPRWPHRVHLTAVPLYPTPLEAVGRAQLLDGWSDHGVGLSACYRALALGAQMLEVHVTLPGRSRELAFDKTPTELRMLRKFAEDCATMTSGVSEQFRTRWSA
jgi:sialic acid synthase SpsE